MGTVVCYVALWVLRANLYKSAELLARESAYDSLCRFIDLLLMTIIEQNCTSQFATHSSQLIDELIHTTLLILGYSLLPLGGSCVDLLYYEIRRKKVVTLLISAGDGSRISICMVEVLTKCNSFFRVAAWRLQKTNATVPATTTAPVITPPIMAGEAEELPLEVPSREFVGDAVPESVILLGESSNGTDWATLLLENGTTTVQLWLVMSKAWKGSWNAKWKEKQY